MTKSTSVHGQPQGHAAQLGQESGSTCPALHPLARQSMSPAGLVEPAAMIPVYTAGHAVQHMGISN